MAYTYDDLRNLPDDWDGEPNAAHPSETSIRVLQSLEPAVLAAGFTIFVTQRFVGMQSAVLLAKGLSDDTFDSAAWIDYLTDMLDSQLRPTAP